MFKIDSSDSPAALTTGRQRQRAHEWEKESPSALKELISIWYLCNIIACGATVADLSLCEC